MHRAFPLTGMACLFALGMGLASASTTGPVAPPTAGAITVTGVVTTGIMAIGGETTGVTISDGKTTYELDIRDPVLKRKAEELNGKSITVKGTLTVKAGVEVGQRRIITVTTLESAATAPATPPSTMPR